MIRLEQHAVLDQIAIRLCVGAHVELAVLGERREPRADAREHAIRPGRVAGLAVGDRRVERVAPLAERVGERGLGDQREQLLVGFA